MPISIDVNSFRKDSPERPLRWGYQTRGGHAPTSIVLHTTNNPNRGTSFIKEAEYLQTSPKVSAHFLVAKDGRIVQFLDPLKFQAWHAGRAIFAFSNPKSIGIELHVSVGERPTPAQLHACAELCRFLMAEFSIPLDHIETHREIAIPGPSTTSDSTKWRKHDPEGMDEQAFTVWRATLANPFEQWGVIGQPEEAARDYAIPRAWLMNKALGACVRAEEYLTPSLSVAVFEKGFIYYNVAKKAASVELF